MHTLPQTLDPNLWQHSYNPWTNSRTDQPVTYGLNSCGDCLSDASSDQSYSTQEIDTTNTAMEGHYLPTLVGKGPGMSVDRRSMDSAYYSSPHSSPWLSSASVSDSCSDTWSSLAASESYSPKPHPRDYPTSFVGWPRDSTGFASRPYTSLSDVQHHPDTAPEYLPSAVVYQPYYHPQWHYAPQPDTRTQVAFGAGEYWDATIYSGPSLNQACESSPAPCTVPESKTSPKRRGRKLVVNQEIKQEPSESTQMNSVKSFQESSKPSSSHISPTASKFTVMKQGGSFLCPLAIYGCGSSFLSKNEWKRHINAQHLCLETWRCDQCHQRNNRPNDFNRKDLFIQHLRRMHCCGGIQKPDTATKKPKHKSKAQQQQKKMEPTSAALWTAERRCHVELRKPPPCSACLYCEKTFVGRDSWALRTEHLAKHVDQFKRDGKAVPGPSQWNRDFALEEWLLGQGILAVKGRHLRLRPGFGGKF